jgi:hypothetical protein
MKSKIMTLQLLAILFVCNISLSLNIAHATPQSSPVRALHVVISPLTEADLIRLTDMAANAGFNTMILDLGGKVAFKSFPGKLSNDPWSREEFLKLVGYIRSKGIDVIPGVQLLTHQGQFLADRHPEVMFSPFVYNPDNPDTYKLVLPYLAEIISSMKPTAIHIGHDEAGLQWNKQDSAFELSGDASILPAKLFLKDILVIDNYLKSQKVETWMWGDMLIAPDEFPLMLARHLHGIANGYGRALRLQIPKDIVICDWHYWDDQTVFPTISAFKAEGFRVLGATWRKGITTSNFSHYASQHGASGMIATTWFEPQRKVDVIVTKWDEVARIIRDSGEAFNKDFPDAK